MNIIYTALSRLNNHIISKERMKLLVIYIFLFSLNYGVPIHPTRYNFTSAYILCHICWHVLITCLYYIRNRFTDQAWEPKNRLDVGCHIFQLFTKKVCVLGIYDVLQKWCVHVLKLGSFARQSNFFDLMELFVISRKTAEKHTFSAGFRLIRNNFIRSRNFNWHAKEPSFINMHTSFL